MAWNFMIYDIYLFTYKQVKYAMLLFTFDVSAKAMIKESNIHI